MVTALQIHGLPDTASQKDTRGITIPSVSVRHIKLPLVLGDRHGGSTIADISLGVSLDAGHKGIHMSRLVRLLQPLQEQPTYLADWVEILQVARDQSHAAQSHLDLAYTRFYRRRAPVTGETGLLSAEERWMLRNNVTVTAEWTVKTTVANVCPCSREISDFGAHNQRVDITVTLCFDPSHGCPVDAGDLIGAMEQQGSSPLYAVLKRADEKHVTESAYDNPKFVEDILRDTVIYLRSLPRLSGFRVDIESHESIHQHNAGAAYEEYCDDTPVEGA